MTAPTEAPEGTQAHPMSAIWAEAWHAWEKDGHWAACEVLARLTSASPMPSGLVSATQIITDARDEISGIAALASAEGKEQRADDLFVLREQLDDLLAALNQSASQSPPVAQDGVLIPRAMFDFLMGVGEIDGASFGDLHKAMPGRFWWRSMLRIAEVNNDRQAPRHRFTSTRGQPVERGGGRYGCRPRWNR